MKEPGLLFGFSEIKNLVNEGTICSRFQFKQSKNIGEIDVRFTAEEVVR